MGQFSVIIATRNRPALFAEALSSVLRQSCHDIETIVVNDGSDEVHLAEYRRLVEGAERVIHFHSLVRRPNGHGAAYARNFAASLASGRYVCFLDDDDFWTDDNYLSRIESAIAKRDRPPDLVFSSQAAVSGNLRKDEPIWLEGLAARLQRSARTPEDGDFYRVNVEELVNFGGFCHMNTMIVRRALFDAVGGMDEDIRWEHDHDLFLRLIDRAETMLLSPAIVSQHNVPAPSGANSVTTAMTEIDRRYDQLRVFDKAALFAAHPAIRARGRLYKGYTLKRIAEALAARKDYRAAAFYAREALGAAPTLKWAGYTVFRLLASARAKSDA